MVEKNWTDEVSNEETGEDMIIRSKKKLYYTSEWENQRESLEKNPLDIRFKRE